MRTQDWIMSVGCLLSLSVAQIGFAQEPQVTLETMTGGEEANYANRKGYVLDVCPHVKIAQFNYYNWTRSEVPKYYFIYKWTNSGAQAIIALEYVTLRYDVFDRPLRGIYNIVPGHKNSDHRPLAPGESDSEITALPYTANDHLYTAIGYVRSVRLADDTVWQVDEKQLLDALKKVVPGIRNLGSTTPEPKDDPKPGKSQD